MSHPLFRNFVKLASFLIIVGIFAYIYLFVQNNKEVQNPDKKEYQLALARATNWMVANKETLLQDNNAILWWFISEAAKASNNTQLQNLTNEYVNRSLPPTSCWRYYFSPYAGVPIDPTTLFHLPPYNIFFVYGLSCNQELGQLDVIKRQLEPNFCRWSRPLVSPCTTHQLMGLNFMQLRGCGDGKQVDNLIRDLQDQVIRQLTIDPRVGDVFIQRAMMLLVTGAGERVKPIWLRQILNAQTPDGSWETFDRLFPVGGSRYFGFSYFFFDIRKHQPNFHTTSQAIYVMSLMAGDHKKMVTPF